MIVDSCAMVEGHSGHTGTGFGCLSCWESGCLLLPTQWVYLTPGRVRGAPTDQRETTTNWKTGLSPRRPSHQAAPGRAGTRKPPMGFGRTESSCYYPPCCPGPFAPACGGERHCVHEGEMSQAVVVLPTARGSSPQPRGR